MSFENYFPLWNDLNTAQKKLISDNLITRNVKKGTIIHNGNLDCTGLLLVKSGQLRTYILSDEGREITLYRQFDMDMCLLSASCIIAKSLKSYGKKHFQDPVLPETTSLAVFLAPPLQIEKNFENAALHNSKFSC